ncbi:peptidylprolyl isomerase [Micrococcales bacterium KH10]|nr:peptidylprolyl isomerase [Micrococcales bacterium KH10]
MKSVTTRVAAVAVAALVALAGCASDSETPTTPPANQTESSPEPSEEPPANDPTVLDGITVEGAAGEKPTITFDAPLAINSSAFKVASAGDGDTIADGDSIQCSLVSVSADDGSELYNNYDADPETLSVNASTLHPDLLEMLIGQQVGVRLILGSPAASETETPASIAVLEVLGIVEVLEDVAADTAGLPSVEFADDGSPTITVPEGFTSPELVQRIVLEEGDGDVVSASDTITAHYTGVKASDSTVFDSSWERGEPIDFSLQQVVQGWTVGLSDVKVGSTVMLIIPPSMGYGASEGHELQNETMVFVVKIEAIADGA